MGDALAQLKSKYAPWGRPIGLHIMTKHAILEETNPKTTHAPFEHINVSGLRIVRTLLDETNEMICQTQEASRSLLLVTGLL